MSQPEQRDSRPGRGAAVGLADQQDDQHPHRTRPATAVTVVGELHAPAGRRTLYVLLVRRCPACAHLHVHRTGRPAATSWSRSGSCGAAYEVVLAPRAVAA